MSRSSRLAHPLSPSLKGRGDRTESFLPPPKVAHVLQAEAQDKEAVPPPIADALPFQSPSSLEPSERFGDPPCERSERTREGDRGWALAAAILLLLCVAGGLFYQLAAPQAPEIEIAGFATTLRGRTASQRYNARRAAEALDGKTIAPGAVFSFNRTVRSWSLDEGYVKAPVSYDGELVRAYGGGVCQTSTTLYNAALLAGLPIVERHSHVFAPHYVPPGRDAAVAQYNIDLRFRNPYPWPIRIQASARNDRLDIRLLGRQRPSTRIEVTSEVLSTIAPLRLTRVLHRRDGATGRAYIRNPGATGYRVVTYRIFSQSGREVRRERLADDTYEAMNRIVQLTEDETPKTSEGE